MTDERTKFKAGDWICWRTMDGLRIAAVVYVRASHSYPYRWQCVTQAGSVDVLDVLECRRVLPPGDTPE